MNCLETLRAPVRGRTGWSTPTSQICPIPFASRGPADTSGSMMKNMKVWCWRSKIESADGLPQHPDPLANRLFRVILEFGTKGEFLCLTLVSTRCTLGLTRYNVELHCVIAVPRQLLRIDSDIRSGFSDLICWLSWSYYLLEKTILGTRGYLRVREYSKRIGVRWDDYRIASRLNHWLQLRISASVTYDERLAVEVGNCPIDDTR